MWEFFWFFLGVLVYKILTHILDISNKGRFIMDIKFLAFQLIGQAFMELSIVRVFRDKTLKDSDKYSEEQLKLIKNEDELFLNNWKKKSVDKLNSSVPPLYKPYVSIKNWEELIQLLTDCHDFSLVRNTRRNTHEQGDKED